jgi:hypothetical protein
VRAVEIRVERSVFVASIVCEIHERSQRERAFFQAGMRYDEPIFTNHFAFNPKEIDVDRARPFVDSSHTAHRCLDRKSATHELCRRERRHDQHSGVDEVVLNDLALRLCLVKRGALEHMQIFICAEARERVFNESDPIPHVRAESEDDSSDVVHA